MSSVELPPAQVASPWATDRTPPWKPRVAGIVGFIFGPLAAALVAFINLRRLGRPQKAFWVLSLSVLGCILFFWSFDWFPHVGTKYLGKFVGNVISPFLYPWLQNQEYDAFVAEHPQVQPANGWRATGWGILGLVGFALTGVMWVLLATPEVTNIDASVRVPPQLTKGEEFAIVIELKNTASEPQELVSIDVGRGFDENTTAVKTQPSFKSTEAQLPPLARSYVFENDIPPNGTMTVTLSGRAVKAGHIDEALGICIRSELSCVDFELKMEIVESE